MEAIIELIWVNGAARETGAIKKDKFYLFYGAVELREKLAQPEEATQLSPFQPASAINSLREKLAHWNWFALAEMKENAGELIKINIITVNPTL